MFNDELNDSLGKRGNDDNDHEKTYYTVNSESFNDKDFHAFLNCLDNIRETTLKRRTNGRVIKNYCVQIPYIDNSIQLNESDELNDQEVDEKCDEMRNDISQMFSYFDEEIDLGLMDDKEEEIKEQVQIEDSPIKIITSRELNRLDRSSRMKLEVSKPKTIENLDVDPEESMDLMDDSYNDFRAKFIKNRSLIEQFHVPFVDTKPVIKGYVKKPNVVTPSQSVNNSLNKNQVDKIMNEFNRVKINYYSKDNYVEFTNIDYFYAPTESDLSTRESEVSKLDNSFLPKIQPTIVVNQMQQFEQETPFIPKNCVKDKIDMFSKMDMIIRPISNELLPKKDTKTKPIKNDFILKNDTTIEPLKNDVMLKKDTMIKPIINDLMLKKDIIKSISNDLLPEKGMTTKPMITELHPKLAPVVKDKIQSKPNMNISGVNKNQNKCFIKDINNSLLNETEKSFNEEFKVPKVPDKYLNTQKSSNDDFKLPTIPEKYLTYPLDAAKKVLVEQQTSYETLQHILNCVPLTDTDLLLNLEQIVNQFNVSLLHTINGLIHDQAFTLETSESKIAKLSIQTQPSIDKFNEQFLNESRLADDGVANNQLEFIDLRVIQSNAIQLQIHFKAISCATSVMRMMQINVIFAAKFLPTDTKTNELIIDNVNEVPEGSDTDVFYIYFTSFFEVHFYTLGENSLSSLIDFMANCYMFLFSNNFT